MKFFVRAAIGNIASAFWFIPPLAKLLHKARGINFVDASSVFLSNGVSLDNRFPELLHIGKDVWLTQGVRVLTHSYCSDYQRKVYGMQEFVAPVIIEDGVFVGVNSIILPGVVLGAGCYIGAGSVVTRSVAPGMLACGSPCREIRKLDAHRTHTPHGADK